MKFEAVKKEVIDKAFELALFAAREQILTDCNKYAKYDTGTMKNTSYTTVRGDTLECVWDTPYARHAWFTGKPSHSGTYLQWAQKAADDLGGEWKRILQKGVSANL